MKPSATSVTTSIIAALLAAVGVAQRAKSDNDDALRDRVVLKQGKEILGRVVQRYDKDEILVLQHGKRIRVKPSEVKDLDTVRDRLQTYFRRRAGLDHSSAATHWELCEWSQLRGLPHMARLEAHAAIVCSPDHRGAHEYLGHRHHEKRGWLWPIKSRWVTASQFVKQTGDIGHGLKLRSENFAILTDAGLEHAVNALFDLERLYVWWHEEYGAQLELDEITEPLEFKVYADKGKFPGRTGERRPYYVPYPHDDVSYSYIDADEKRPEALIRLGSEHILYRCLARRADPGDADSRLCAWVELGIAQHVQSRFAGDPGVIEVGPPAIDPVIAAAALNERRYSLKNLLHLQLRDHFYAGGSASAQSGRPNAEVHWAAVQMFATFLLDEQANPGLRPKLCGYLQLALREGRGDSSSAFDTAIGQPIERFEKPWLDWLQTQAANPTKPR